MANTPTPTTQAVEQLRDYLRGHSFKVNPSGYGHNQAYLEDSALDELFVILADTLKIIKLPAKDISELLRDNSWGSQARLKEAEIYNKMVKEHNARLELVVEEMKANAS